MVVRSSDGIGNTYGLDFLNTPTTKPNLLVGDFPKAALVRQNQIAYLHVLDGNSGTIPKRDLRVRQEAPHAQG
jgi:hypothetical protein